ncbi:unnamed protein product [Effrenium voratum]|uniref:Uncharacterized protein n=1 Tax=Effrenium voratum TaxID=2562239 RepID=A0AA36NG12_9DINO|nr:unnamed protein product [Effrenium voratum]
MGHSAESAAEAKAGAFEAIRRGNRREKREQLALEWEHVEVTFHEDLELTAVSSLVLGPDARFSAGCKPRLGAAEASAAWGTWRRLGRGVELTLGAEEAIGLEEMVVVYRCQRGCLVAERVDLPDGLAQAPLPEQPKEEAASGGGAPSEVYEDDFEEVASDESAEASPKSVSSSSVT